MTRALRALSPEEPCGLILWIVEEKRHGGASVLLYGWFSRRPPRVSKDWGASEFHLDGGVRVARLSTTDTGASLLDTH